MIQLLTYLCSVKSRLFPLEGGPATTGLSFTEFSYQLMQAYDYCYLHERMGCSVQLGGSDQMGNIMAGIDLIRRQRAAHVQNDKMSDLSMRADPAYGLTLPLLMTSSGVKFGKSAGNAVWISPALLSDLDFYQYFVRSADADVERYLTSLTFMPLEEIKQVMILHSQDRSKRVAQICLANEMTELVRGPDALRRAQLATKVLFDTDVNALTLEQILYAFEGDPRLVRLTETQTTDLLRLAAEIGLVSSRSTYSA